MVAIIRKTGPPSLAYILRDICSRCFRMSIFYFRLSLINFTVAGVFSLHCLSWPLMPASFPSFGAAPVSLQECITWLTTILVFHFSSSDLSTALQFRPHLPFFFSLLACSPFSIFYWTNFHNSPSSRNRKK